jgi:hypothetical protein
VDRKTGTSPKGCGGEPPCASLPLLDEEAARWKVGDSGKVRYHPDFPEEHRWLE